MRTYLFYDIETSGLSKAFDQVLQFACIRTDENLNEISRESFYVKLSPDTIPAPLAALTHQISLDKLAKEGISELEAIKKIHKLLNTAETTSLGYNSLKFDDEFLRFSFYRYLLAPYTHQYANECKRADLYPMVVMVFLYCPEMIQWYWSEDKLSLRLEDLNRANQWNQGQAHDAMVDVEITLALARALKKNPEMWNYLISNFDKSTDLLRQKKLPVLFDNFQHGILVDGQAGFLQRYQNYVLCLGQHFHYKNQTLWLRLDDERLSEATPSNFEEKTWIIKKKAGELGIILPPQDKYLNQLNPEKLKLAKANIQFLEKNKNLLKLIQQNACDFKYPPIPRIDAQAALYQNRLLSYEEEQQNIGFHQVATKDKLAFLEKFTHPMQKALALRLLGKFYPDSLSAEWDEEYQHYLSQVRTLDPTKTLIDETGKQRQTVAQTLEEIDSLVKSGRDEKILVPLKNYLIKHMLKNKVV